MLVCVFLCMFAHETAGAARTRLSLRPLSFWRDKRNASLGRLKPRDRETVSIRHCEERSDEAIHLSPSCTMDCFAYARNDVERIVSHRQRDRIFHLAQRKARLD